MPNSYRSQKNVSNRVVSKPDIQFMPITFYLRVLGFSNELSKCQSSRIEILRGNNRLKTPDILHCAYIFKRVTF